MLAGCGAWVFSHQVAVVYISNFMLVLSLLVILPTLLLFSLFPGNSFVFLLKFLHHLRSLLIVLILQHAAHSVQHFSLLSIFTIQKYINIYRLGNILEIFLRKHAYYLNSDRNLWFHRLIVSIVHVNLLFFLFLLVSLVIFLSGLINNHLFLTVGVLLHSLLVIYTLCLNIAV